MTDQANNNDYKYDVFISYSRNDSYWVENTLVPHLKNNGISYCIDKEDFEIGANLIDSMKDAIEQSRKTVLVLTPDYVKSKWTKFERDLLLSADIVSGRNRILPILAETCTPPEELNFLNIVDLTNKNDLTTQIKRLIDAIISPAIETSQTAPAGYMSGAVLYAKVSAYTVLSRELRNKATYLIETILKDFLNNHEKVYLDFKGGDLLLFIKRKENEEKFHTSLKVFVLGLLLQLKANSGKFKIGVTIHWEDNAEIKTIGSCEQFLGPALNEVKLLMSFSDKGHFFLSHEIYRELKEQLENAQNKTFSTLLGALKNFYRNLESNWLNILNEFKNTSTYLFNFELPSFIFYDSDKHQHDLYNFSIKNQNVSVGQQTLPNHKVALEHRDTRERSSSHVFIQRLVEADEVCLIGLTHEGTKMFLDEALKIRQDKFWKKLQIVFPSQSVIETIIETKRTKEERLNRWFGGKREIFMFLLEKARHVRSQWECLEYNGNLSFVGGRYISFKNSFIRLAPILPGIDMKEVYYMEIFKDIPEYDQLDNAINVICNLSISIMEWNIYGEMKDNKFTYKGVAKRESLEDIAMKNQNIRFCFPVVLVVLYTEKEFGQIRSLLQFRTIFNSESDLNNYSNLSGRLIDRDIFASQNKIPSENYFNYIYGKKSLEINEKDVYCALRNELALNRGDSIPEDTWKMAAIREVKEELGIDINIDNLEFRNKYCLNREKFDLFFNIYSLKIEHDQLDKIKNSRPHSELEEFDLARLEQFHREGKFNRLLQNKFIEIFLPIFTDLKID